MNIRLRKVAFYNPQTLRNSLLFIMVIAFICISGTLYAQNLKPEGWYRIRTNSVPYKPGNVAVDSSGGVWVTAINDIDDTQGVWYRPAEPMGGGFQYLTNNARNNLFPGQSNPPVVIEQLETTVLHAARDNEGNTWYAFNDRTVKCERPDHTWLTFNMSDSSWLRPGIDTTNVDSVHRIRFLDKPDGSQEVLLIAARSVKRIGNDLLEEEERLVNDGSNYYFIQDALIDSQGRYWVVSEAGLVKGTNFINTKYVKDEYSTDPNAPKGPVSRIMEDTLGNIWFASDFYAGDGIYCYTSDGQWEKYSVGLVSDFGNRAHDIAAGKDGSVWFGCVYSGREGAVLRYMPNDGGQWTLYTQANLGLQSAQVLSMSFDSSGGLWFITAWTSGVTGNGTGVHYLQFSGGVPNVTHYTYRDNSTTLTSLMHTFIAADLSGGVWFPSNDSPSIARLKADGTWQQFRQSGGGSFGNFSFEGSAADSKNRVYFAPQNSRPIAYDVNSERWVDLPLMSYTDYYYYGVYVDPEDGKWFYGEFGAYYLDPENSAWTWYDSSNEELFPDYRVDGVLMDDEGNVWFMAWYGLALMKKNPEGGDPQWFRFVSEDESGYSNGYSYHVFQDDEGGIWNSGGQKYVPESNTWVTITDTSPYDHRKLRFLNGTVPVDFDLTNALPPVSLIDEELMTVDSRGTIYFTGGRSDLSAGIVAFGPLNGDLNKNGAVDLGDVILAAKVLVDEAAGVSANGDVSGDLKIGIAEMIFTLQRISGLR